MDIQQLTFRNIEVDVTVIGDLVRLDDAWTCERCDHVFIGQYFSAEHCNETGNDLTLCEECCEAANAGREDPQDHATAAVVDAQHSDAIAQELDKRGLLPTVVFRYVSLEDRVQILADNCKQWAINARAAAARGGVLGRPDLSHGMAVTYDNLAAILRQFTKT